MFRRITRCLALATTMSLVVGCSSVPKDEYEAALSENAELRDKLASAQSMLERSEGDKQQLLQENQDLSADLSRVKQSPAAAAGAAGPVGSTTRASGDVVLSVAGDVLFDSGQVTLKAAGRRELDRIARLIMTQYSTNTIRVEGYTDSDPIRKSKWKSNEHLSAERALAVENYLVARGVDGDRIYSAAMGSASPKSNKEASRRVEIVILAK
ncbi:MAG: OmpA family protein [Phycisphaeraceae bacterium]|nr:MAG: OmpA family protein [Phycisphaeraceae bacterium]